MLLKYLDEIDEALKHELYFAALTLALVIPDICGKAEYPNKSVGDRYRDWFEENIGQYEKEPVQEGQEEFPYLSGEVVYKLRCSMLHQGNPNVEKDSIHNEVCQIDHFILVLEEKNELDIYSDSSSISHGKWINSDGTEILEPVVKTYKVNVCRLCFLICTLARQYYEKNTEKFHFFDYEIEGWRKQRKY